MEPMTTVKRQYQKMQCKMRILILAVLCFYHQATIHPCLGQPMNATCQGTKSTLTIGCTLYKNVPITLDLKCKEQESHSTVCLCQENNCQCPSVNYSVTENSPIKREIVISGFNCEPEALVCNPISGELDSPSSHPSYTLTNCTLTSRGQPMNATCEGTKSTLTIGCMLYEKVTSFTLDLKCKEQESHSTVCLCQENNCKCPSVNYSVTENSPIKRKIVISGLNCEPETLFCIPVSGEFDIQSSHLSPPLANCTLTSQENKESSPSVLLVVLVTIFIISGATGAMLAVCWKNCCGIRDKFSDIFKVTKKVTYGHQDDKENTVESLVQNAEERTLSSHTAEQEQELSENESTELRIVRNCMYSSVIEQSVSCMGPEAESAIVPSGASRQVENKYRVDHQELPTGAMENNGAMTCRVHLENTASS